MKYTAQITFRGNSITLDGLDDESASKLKRAFRKKKIIEHFAKLDGGITLIRFSEVICMLILPEPPNQESK